MWGLPERRLTHMPTRFDSRGKDLLAVTSDPAMDAADRETVAETGIEGFEAAMRRCLICSSCPTRSAKSLRNIWACSGRMRAEHRRIIQVAAVSTLR